MGISANQSRLMTLTARQHDLELQAQTITQKKTIMALKTQSLALEFSNAMNAATNSGGYVNEATLEAARATYEEGTTKISAEEKILDLQLQQINTEHNAVKTEYDSTKSLIQENTEKSFSLFG